MSNKKFKKKIQTRLRLHTLHLVCAQWLLLCSKPIRETLDKPKTYEKTTLLPPNPHLPTIPFVGYFLSRMGLVHTVKVNVKSDLHVGPAEASFADWYWACGSRLVFI